MKIYWNSYSSDSKKSILSETVKTLVSSICYHIRFEIRIMCNVMHLNCKQFLRQNLLDFLKWLYYLNLQYGLNQKQGQSHCCAAWADSELSKVLLTLITFYKEDKLLQPKSGPPGQGRVSGIEGIVGLCCMCVVTPCSQLIWLLIRVSILSLVQPFHTTLCCYAPGVGNKSYVGNYLSPRR